MNSSVKISLRVASVGLLLDMLYIVLREVSAFHNLIASNLTILNALNGIFNALVLCSISWICIALFTSRNQLPVQDKRLRIYAFLAANATLLFMALSLINPFFIGGKLYLHLQTWQHSIIIMLTVCFLWKISCMEQEEERVPLSKSLSTALLTTGILSCIVLLFILISVMFLCTGHVLGDNIKIYFYLLPAWMKGIVPGLLFTWYALYTFSISKKQLRNLLVWLVIITLVAVIVLCVSKELIPRFLY